MRGFIRQRGRVDARSRRPPRRSPRPSPAGISPHSACARASAASKASAWRSDRRSRRERAHCRASSQSAVEGSRLIARKTPFRRSPWSTMSSRQLPRSALGRSGGAAFLGDRARGSDRRHCPPRREIEPRREPLQQAARRIPRRRCAAPAELLPGPGTRPGRIVRKRHSPVGAGRARPKPMKFGSSGFVARVAE